MRLLALTLVLAALPTGATEFPFWEGEPIEEYAKNANLEPTRRLDLGHGVAMEMVLVPAGSFIMGTPEPKPVDEIHYAFQKWLGLLALTLSTGVLVVLLGSVVMLAVRRKRRPQMSLARLLVLGFVAGVGLLGGLHRHYSEKKLVAGRAEYEAAVFRFKQVDASEIPARRVTIETPFYMGKYEVTQEQYQAVMGELPIRLRTRLVGPDRPVVYVTWNDAKAFCQQLSSIAELTVRLPHEDEWERACRAGTQTVYHSGDTDDDLNRVGWRLRNYKGRHLHPVGKKEPNAWALYDMHGNVAEWCMDAPDEKFKGEGLYAADRDAVGFPEQYRLVRGGSDYCYRNCRAAYRLAQPLDRCTSFLGFRVVVEVQSGGIHKRLVMNVQ